MRVLFVCDFYYPHPGASALCLKNILNELSKEFVACDVLNVAPIYGLPKCVSSEEGLIYNFRDDYRIPKTEARKSPIRFLRFLLFRVLGRINGCALKTIKTNQVLRAMERIYQRYDCFVAVVSDFNNAAAVEKYSRKSLIPFVVYQLDPISTNLTQIKYKKRLAKFERLLYKNASGIISTPINAKEIASLYPDYINKIIAADFPLLTPIFSSGKKNPHSRIICTFCGSLINGIRECDFALELFSLVKNDDLLIRFVGAGQEETISRYKEGLLKGRLIHEGVVEKTKADEIVSESDFLINIGNIMNNQVPSKLFGYFSTGIPIINICENNECPTIEYVEKYGLSLTLVKNDNISIETKRHLLEAFIKSMIGKRRRYEEIQKDFSRCVPDYVADQMLEVIKGACKSD